MDYGFFEKYDCGANSRSVGILETFPTKICELDHNYSSDNLFGPSQTLKKLIIINYIKPKIKN